MVDKYYEVLVWNGKCLVIPYAHNLTWFEAREECKRIGAELAVIDSQGIQDRVLLASPGVGYGWDVQAFWIGLTRVQWKWKLGTCHSMSNHFMLIMSKSYSLFSWTFLSVACCY